MKLSYLAKIAENENILVKVVGDCDFSAMGFDSRCVEKNSLFFVKGANFKKEFLVSSVKNGAACYVAEKEFEVDVPHVIVSDIRVAMALFSMEFYNHPTSKFTLVGITGTKGKTSTAYMLRSIFDEFFGEDFVGTVSTIEATCGREKLKKSGTTPEALPLNGIFDRFAQKGIKASVIEVSSQALQYDRVKYMDLDIGIFLNLSLDHQSPDEHASFDEYKSAKLKLFSMCKNAVVNADSEFAKEFLKASEDCQKVYTYGICDKTADFYADNIEVKKDGSKFTLMGKYVQNETFELPVPGEFNIYNALSAIAASYSLGIDCDAIRKGILKGKAQGRMDIYEKDGITVITDYAHNGFSLNAVFDYVERFYPNAKTTCLFGCPGGKAFDRRKTLPEAAGTRGDFVVITADDPGFENVEDIMNQIEKNLLPTGTDYVKIADREEAVKFAVKNATTGDVIILAGKGHETAQSVKGKSVEYPGDMQTAKAFLE